MENETIVHVNGVDLGVATFGDPGDPAILLIGGAGSSMDWWEDEFCSRLAAGLRFVIRYDSRDTGRSVSYQPEAPPYTVEDLAGDAVGLLDAFALPRAHLVGISMGGALVQRLAVEHPDRVASLILIDSGDPVSPPLGQVSARTLVIHAAEDLVPAILRHSSGGWDEQGDRLASRALAAGDPTGWFDRLYGAAAAGEVPMPWDRTEPHPLLTQWARGRQLTGTGQRAVVVGCGLGADAEYVSGIGFDTVAFDVADTAIQLARERFPDSTVHYMVANLLHPPDKWWRAFDLVVEIITVQALPDPPRRQAIVNVGRLVAAGGTLIVIAAMHDERHSPAEAPPWPLSRAEIDAFATDGLTPVRIERLPDPRRPSEQRWRAEFNRPQ
jgi:pimeloyl-ACP methyl ester carboxylesterase